MKAIVLKEYGADLAGSLKNLHIEERAIRSLQKGEVLIKVEGTTCNPSDLAFIQGIYGIKKQVPVVPGFEGTGRIIGASEDAMSQAYLGKRVIFFGSMRYDGTWAEQAVTDVKMCIPIREDIPIEQAAGMLVNPYTAYALVQLAKNRKSNAIIQSAALSQVGVMVRKLAKIYDIKVINIVRNPEQVELFLNSDEIVLNSSDLNFNEQLKYLADDYKATTAFDAVSGTLTGDILKSMPAESQIILYGTLSGEGVQKISARDLIFFRKSIRGFILKEWFETTDYTQVLDATVLLQNLFAKGELKTQVREVVSMYEFADSIQKYLKNMSMGKIVLTFD